jgi:hypothetical protein
VFEPTNDKLVESIPELQGNAYFRVTNINAIMKEPKIVHVHFKATNTDDYFSSIKAAFQYYDKTDLGLQYRSLVNALHDDGYYENKLIVVRIGYVKSNKQSAI